MMTPYMNDDDYTCGSSSMKSTVTAHLSGGTYYNIVDGYYGFVGSYQLNVTISPYFGHNGYVNAT